MRRARSESAIRRGSCETRNAQELKQCSSDRSGRMDHQRGPGGRGIIRADFPPRDSLIASRTTVTRDHPVR